MFNRRDFLSHPTSMQSLVSSSATTAATAITTADGIGVSNPGLLAMEAATPSSGSPTHHDHQDCNHHRHLSHRHHLHRSPSCQRSSGWSGGCAKRVGCVRSALLAAFVLILLGVIVTSSYAIDRRFSQIPQLLYAGLGLCSLGLIVIVVSVSLLVSRQLRKRRPGRRQDYEPREEQRLQFLLDGRAAVADRGHSGRRATSSGAGRVPIWYIGCHRDTATAYYPPVPPSYWDSGAAAPPAQNILPKPPPPPPTRALPPPPPPQPPSYQEALRCLGGSCDQMSVLKWTVQPSSQQQQHFQALQLQQRSQAFLQQRSQAFLQQRSQAFLQQQQQQRGTGVRRCESSSFIGEPILV